VSVTAIGLRGGARIRAADGLEFRRAGGETAVFPRQRIADPRGFDIEAAAVNVCVSNYNSSGGRGLKEAIAVPLPAI